MSEIHITTTEIIKTKTPISDTEKRIVQSMVVVGNSKEDIENHLMKQDLILLNQKGVTRVHFVDSGKLAKEIDKIRNIINLDNELVEG